MTGAHGLAKTDGGQRVVDEPSVIAVARTGPIEHQDGAAIEVEDLAKVYAGGKTALAGVSFSVGRGEIFGFLGPNGSGKTTTVRILVTLLRKTSGTARVVGFDSERQADRVRAMIGYAGQSVGVDDDLTGVENLALGGVLHGVLPDATRRRAAQLLEAFSLTEVATVRAGRLSGGLRRRLDLAQALVHAPAVLFLDEPTSGLDPQSRNALWGLLRHLSQDGTTVFLTTQYLEEADRACDRVAILDEGPPGQGGHAAGTEARGGWGSTRADHRGRGRRGAGSAGAGLVARGHPRATRAGWRSAGGLRGRRAGVRGSGAAAARGRRGRGRRGRAGPGVVGRRVPSLHG